jgi:hypothetical protein
MELDKNTFITAAALAITWSMIWAALHQWAKPFRYALHNLTFVAVIIGCAGNLVILYFLVDLRSWVITAVVFAFSSSFVAIRSLYDKQKDEEGVDSHYRELSKAIEEAVALLRTIGGTDDGTGKALGVLRHRGPGEDQDVQH